MRVLFGIILGVALTVGVAFISDTWATGPVATDGSGSAQAANRDRKSTRLNSSHIQKSRMPSSA